MNFSLQLSISDCDHRQTYVVYAQGTGVLKLKDGGNVIKWNCARQLSDGTKQNVDLSGIFYYDIKFPLNEGGNISVAMSGSKNMNTVLGQLEFVISDTDTQKIKLNGTNIFTIQINNPDKSTYVYYQGKYEFLSNN